MEAATTANSDRPHFNDTDEHERWLSVYEVASQVLARPDTVQRWVRDGLLRAEQRGRLGLRIPKSAVDQFMLKQYQSEGFRSADHSFSSGTTDEVLPATAVPEGSLKRQAAGWPFRADPKPSPSVEPEAHEGKPPIPGGL
jgi:excisionase family DNA binding protein